MRVIVDAFGGDNAPLEVIKGCILAKNEYNVDITLTGDVEKIKQCANQNNLDIGQFKLINASTVIPVEADPTSICKEYSDSSMAVAFKLLADGEGDAVVCAGSTGAIVVGASLIIKRIKGIKRAALAPIMPSENNNYILLDVGANLECRPEMLKQFAIMGSIYMEKVMDVKNPKVGLVNIGAEETKGLDLQIETYKLLKDSNTVNFVGNIEPRYIPKGDCDVVIADGFTGNVILKLTEGMGKFMSNSIKDIFGGAIGKLCGALVIKKIKALKKKMDYKEHGGAPLLGISKPVIKAHGSSNDIAFKNAIRQAITFYNQDVIGLIQQQIKE
ncbi:MAG: phosphate acyltransferase PlsX [Oscillospiraceae bacterium]